MRRIVYATILAVLLAVPALAQPWEGYYQPTDDRRPDFAVLVLDPTGGPGADRYHFVSLETLFAGLDVFPDLRPRYVAVKARGIGLDPAFTAAELLAGAVVNGVSGRREDPGPADRRGVALARRRDAGGRGPGLCLGRPDEHGGRLPARVPAAGRDGGSGRRLRGVVRHHRHGHGPAVVRVSIGGCGVKAWRIVSALVVAVALAASASAQQQWGSSYDTVADRQADFVVLVEIPGTTTGTGPGAITTPPTYRRILFSDLLAGLVTFDSHTRYVAVLPLDTTYPTVPTFTAAHFVASDTSVVGVSEGVALPAVTGSPPAAWLAVALPHDVPLEYVAFGAANIRNLSFLFAKQTDTIMLGAPPVEYDVWANQNNSVSLTRPGFVYFAVTATAP